MAAVSGPTTQAEEPMELHAGDRMTREEFHRIYEQMPENFKAELIGGTVYGPSPSKHQHGSRHLMLATVFGVYEARTPGLDAGEAMIRLVRERLVQLDTLSDLATAAACQAAGFNEPQFIPQHTASQGK